MNTNIRPSVLPMDIIKLAFPHGTQFELVDQNSKCPSPDAWKLPPNWPPDLFGVMAYLIEQAGAYHHLTPGAASIGTPAFEIVISKKQREAMKKDAAEWRSSATHVSKNIQKAWSNIINSKRSVGAGRTKNKKGLPAWWEDAIMLAAYADETCVHIGHAGMGSGASPDGFVANWVKVIVDTIANQEIKASAGGKKGESTPEHVRISEGPFSICLAASEDIFCVLPKGRTPDIGCTIRSLSQNLSLHPASGVLQTGWRQVPLSDLGPPDKTPFNCLFIPFPYEINPSSFKVTPGGKNWNWFELEQKWLPTSGGAVKKFLKFIDGLVDEANSACGAGVKINTILFPEYSLTWDLHDKIVDHIQSQRDKCQKSGKECRYSSFEFLISGASESCVGDKGNFVLTTQIVDSYDGAVKRKTAVSTSRTKHHRWQITPYQITSYGLEEGFENPDPDTDEPLPAYWEKIDIPRRRIHTNQFRNESILATLICEDLARAEPVHKYVRAVGPNIIFVLLMDGCQIASRWPARYAMGLAEDPGSAVVTLTSRGLVALSNKQRTLDDDKNEPNWNVGLSRNPGGTPKALDCPPGKQAVLMTFRAKNSEELTIDGRFKNTGWTWWLDETSPIGLAENEANKKMIKKFNAG